MSKKHILTISGHFFEMTPEFKVIDLQIVGVGKCFQIFKIFHSFWVISKKLEKVWLTFTSATNCILDESLLKPDTQKLSVVPMCGKNFIKIGVVVSEKLALQKRLTFCGADLHVFFVDSCWVGPIKTSIASMYYYFV